MTPQRVAGSSGWRAVGASVAGAGHVRRNLPNQDAICWRFADERQQVLALAVADGHGSPRYVRSHLGAAAAVRIAVRVLTGELIELYEQADSLTGLHQACREWLPKILERRWQHLVLRHQRLHPFSGAEKQALGPSADESTPPVAYGSTLLAALLTPQFLLYLQLGDGDILSVSTAGQVERPPFKSDERLLANETTSLCMPNAWRFVRVHLQPLVDRPPELLLLATDGYANSFVDEAAFRQVGADLHQTIREQGVEHLRNQLPGWLQTTSAAGSGDDISLVIAVGAIDH